ncbi:MAG: NADH-quinone oxidoreductase subunit J [Gemmatimonadota bacterium]
MQDFLFFALAAASVLGALLMVTRRNPVSAVVLLIAVFFAMSGLFLMLDAHYIAAINVILYAGAIMVLFLFVIMLLNAGHANWRDLRGPLGGLVGGGVAIGFLGLLSRHFLIEATGGAAPEAGAALRAATATEGAVGIVARPLFGDYAVVFELTGLLLLAAIIGTVLLARRETP